MPTGAAVPPLSRSVGSRPGSGRSKRYGVIVPLAQAMLVPVNPLLVRLAQLVQEPVSSPALASNSTVIELTVPGVVVTRSWVPFAGRVPVPLK